VTPLCAAKIPDSCSGGGCQCACTPDLNSGC
jgi:hypothetical protein